MYSGRLGGPLGGALGALRGPWGVRHSQTYDDNGDGDVVS